jgi:hypothetical protein
METERKKSQSNNLTNGAMDIICFTQLKLSFFKVTVPNLELRLFQAVMQ